MNNKELKKNLKSYSKYYRNVLLGEGIENVDQRMMSYETRLREMYNSKEFETHNIYPSTNVSFVYAVMAMCLELKDAGMILSSVYPESFSSRHMAMTA